LTRKHYLQQTPFLNLVTRLVRTLTLNVGGLILVSPPFKLLSLKRTDVAGRTTVAVSILWSSNTTLISLNGGAATVLTSRHDINRRTSF